MRKMMKPLSIFGVALIVVLSGLPLGLVHSDVPTTDGAVLQLTKVTGVKDVIETVEGPDVTYTYVYITNQQLDPTKYIDKGPFTHMRYRFRSQIYRLGRAL